MTLADALRIMDLKAGSTEAEVRKAYRDLAMTWHPDKVAERNEDNADNLLPEQREAEAEEKMKELNAAYELVMEDAHSRTPKGRCARCKGKRKVKVGSGLETLTIACPDCSTVK